MEEEYRSVEQLYADVISSEESLTQFSDLLDTCFSVPKGARYFDDFPVWSEKHSVYPLLRVGVFHRKKLISSAAIRITSLKSPGHQNRGPALNVALIGAVATEPTWRGMGLASRTVSIALQWAMERGASVAVLWTSEHRLYQKLGFELIGQQVRVPINKVKSVGANQIKTQEGWSPSLFELIQQRPQGLNLCEKDRSWFEAHKNVRWVYAGSAKQPRAYVGIGRGIDLDGIIHEWGGDAEALSALLNDLRVREPQLSLLCSPHLFPEGIVSDLEQERIEPLCMAKVLDPVRLMSEVYPDLVNNGSIQIGMKGGLCSLTIGSELSAVLSQEDLAKLVFGSPSSDSSDCDFFVPGIWERSGLFPVPFWIWGLDAA